MASATGSPPTRVLDGADDEFRPTPAAIDSVIFNAAETWTIIIKAKSFVDNGDDYWIEFGDVLNNNYVRLLLNTGKLKLGISEGGAAEDNSTANDLTESTANLYIAAWADGTKKVRGGFASSKIVAWNGLPANQRFELASLKGGFNGIICSNAHNYLFNTAIGIGLEVACTAFYVILSKICLIDNSA